MKIPDGPMPPIVQYFLVTGSILGSNPISLMNARIRKEKDPAHVKILKLTTVTTWEEIE